MKTFNLIASLALSTAVLAFSSSASSAPQVTGELGSANATSTADAQQLPTPEPAFGGVIKQKAADSTAWWAPRIVPPKGAPNVLLIMTDDSGFGAPGTFGGVVPTPALDRIAKAGLRYTNFHSTSLCSPSRAALITGRNHHVAGSGVVGEIATGFPGYNSVIRKETGTLGAILKDNGYATSWFGKNHNTPFYQSTQAGPFDQWPNGLGFEYFYGFMGGDASQWQPNLYRNTTAIFPFEGKPGWNLTTAMADEAIQYMKQIKAIAPDKPFLVYYAPGGTHSPHHPTPEWIDKIGALHLFDQGWNKLRETIFANQQRLGIMPAEAKLTPWPKELPEWDTLGWKEKKLFIKQADVFGAYLAYTDHEIGRVIQTVEDLGQLDNTLIIYIAGDNGASPEGMLNGTPNEFTTFNGVAVPVDAQFAWYPFWGSDKTFPHFAAPWAWALDTPFKWTKQVASHYGGTSQGMAISWPGHINDVGGIRRQFHHLIDIVPTILEATAIPAPQAVNGVKQRPMDGVSLAYTWNQANANTPTRHNTQYFEMLGNRAIYHEGWLAATTPATLPWELSSKPAPDVIDGYQWELYNVTEDPTEFNDLAAKMPDKLKQMQELFYAEAAKHDVLPLDNSSLTRWNAPKPNLTGGRKVFNYSGVLTGVPNSGAPSILNKSYRISAEVTIPEGGAEGMIVTDGGRFGGYGLFLSKGVLDIRRSKPVFLYNLLNLKRTVWAGPELDAGKHSIVFEFTSKEPGLGKGGTGVLSVDGKEVARNSMENSTPITFPEDETFDVGQDTRTGVALLEYRYDVPFAFTGEINKLSFNLEPEQVTPEERAAMAKTAAQARD
ncbi:MAG: arylsulfatase [Pseudomonas sp.]|uniref:arylsulfatase n=1 Tax=Pseudomonas sp. TaxID=306 RepID=UPI003BB4F0CF